jgi:hypothetical protein
MNLTLLLTAVLLAAAVPAIAQGWDVSSLYRNGIERGTYSLFGAVPQGEDVAAPQSARRVNELIGDASLQDVTRYGRPYSRDGASSGGNRQESGQ